MLRIIGGLLGFVAALVIVIYIASAFVFSKTYEFSSPAFSLADHDVDIDEGRRIAVTRGCYRGCHGDLEGALFFDAPGLARLVAPNLTLAAQIYTDAELERIIRHGVRPDGSAVIGMPSASFYHLSDQDLANVLAFIRSEPVFENDLPSSRIDVGARLFVLLGEFTLDAENIDHDAPRMAVVTDDAVAYGEYLAITTCSECHGLDLGGDGDFSPDLAIAAAYSREQFEHLIETGEALGGRDLGLMSQIAARRLAAFNAQERDALHAFLIQKPAKPQAD